MSQIASFSRSVPPRLDELPAVRADLRRWLGELEVQPQIAEDVVLAAWELCANAIEHPAQPLSRNVAVDAEASPSGIRLTVHDAGIWTGTKPMQANRGLGLRIVSGLVDRLAIERGFGGTQVILYRRTRPT
jgi:anti-sigma regulatory factor (Ser/Thr protein kinase)